MFSMIIWAFLKKKILLTVSNSTTVEANVIKPQPYLPTFVL